MNCIEQSSIAFIMRGGKGKAWWKGKRKEDVAWQGPQKTNLLGICSEASRYGPMFFFFFVCYRETNRLGAVN